MYMYTAISPAFRVYMHVRVELYMYMLTTHLVPSTRHRGIQYATLPVGKSKIVVLDRVPPHSHHQETYHAADSLCAIAPPTCPAGVRATEQPLSKLIGRERTASVPAVEFTH